MDLYLPPKSLVRCDEKTARYVHDRLTSVMAGHPQATSTYHFYEEVDSWLGPWGASGYLIGYGKLYNIAFTQNQNLMANPVTKKWVWRTTIYLQEAIRDYLVKRVQDCSISTLTEPQLRQAAFDSHPNAYDRGGLATVVLTAPELIVIVATIPAAEFSPASPNFDSTIKQLFITLGLVIPRVTGGAFAVLAGPAHTGLLSRAVRQDRQRYFNQMGMIRELGILKDQIHRGKLDHIPWLNQTIAQLNARQFPDQEFARMAREVILEAQVRKRLLLKGYNSLLNESPDVRNKINQEFPKILNRTTE